MTAKRKAKASGERRQRKFTPWESDRATPSAPSSLGVLMEWLTVPGNALRWRQARARRGLCQEVLTALEGHGIANRELGDVNRKMGVLEKQFVSASAFLSIKKATAAFARGEADAETTKRALRLCPQYRELVAVFGKVSMDRKAQLGAAAGAAAVQSSGAATAPSEAAGGASAAGKWKESLEGNRPRTASEEQGEKNAEQMQSTVVHTGSADSAQKKVGEIHDAAATNGEKSFVEGREKAGDMTGGVVEKEAGPRNSADGKGSSVIVEEEGGALADVEEDHSEDEPKTQIHVESEAGSSEEEGHEHREAAAAGAKSKYFLKTKKQPETEESSSQEESSEDENDDSQDEEEEERDVDGEERIPLAQPDEEQDEEDKVKRDAEADNSDRNDNNEADEQGEEEQEKEDTENEAESWDEDGDEGDEEEVDDGGREVDAAKASDDSESSSSESENEYVEVEAVPTVEEHESENGDNNDDEMEEAVPPRPVERSGKPPVQPQTSLKRASGSVPSPHPKRARNGSHSMRDLEREEYIERAKQEQAQRQTMFQLERAKLEGELEATRINLVVTKTLARKKLLSAGVDPAEVDRVLPM